MCTDGNGCRLVIENYDLAEHCRVKLKHASRFKEPVYFYYAAAAYYADVYMHTNIGIIASAYVLAAACDGRRAAAAAASSTG